MELSEIIVGVRNLSAAADRVSKLGFTVLEGGTHPRFGTANYIVPLGRQYVELLGVVDPAIATQNDYGRSLLRHVAQGDRLVRWSLRTERIEEVAHRLELKIEHRSRVRPDGSLLTWRAAGLALSLEHAWLPFFMQWDNPLDYPGAQPARHACGAHGVSALEVCAEDEAQFARWIEGEHELPIVRISGKPGLGRVILSTPTGAMAFPVSDVHPS